MQKRLKHPQDRYAMANGCYDLGGQPIYFKPTDLGQYLLYTPTGSSSSTAARRRRPATRRSGPRVPRKHGFTFTNAGKPLMIAGQAHVPAHADHAAAPPTPRPAIDVSGKPHAGVTPYQEVRGYVDAHTHGMAFEFLGGDAHCGKPWDRFGAPYALVDCPDHIATGGYGGVLEDVLSGRAAPRPDRLADVQGLAGAGVADPRGHLLQVARAVLARRPADLRQPAGREQPALQALPAQARTPCDDMDSIRLQATDMYEMQDYIDAQFGGPGKGFYRIVTNPFQARKVINAGKMAVVMGIETSVPFGCTMKLDVPAVRRSPTSTASSTRCSKLGVRQMELVNKFDNALSGVAGDNGAVGAAVNAANFLETGSFWDMRHCEPADGETHDQRPGRGARASPPSSRTRCSARSRQLAAAAHRRCRSTRRRTTATRAA